MISTLTGNLESIRAAAASILDDLAALDALIGGDSLADNPHDNADYRRKAQTVPTLFDAQDAASAS